MRFAPRSRPVPLSELLAQVKRWSGIRPVSSLTNEAVITAFIEGQRVALRKAGPRPMPPATHRRIMRLRASGMTQAAIADLVGVTQTTVWRVVSGRQAEAVEVERKAVCR